MAHFVILQNQLNKNKLNIQLEDSWIVPIPSWNGSQKGYIFCLILFSFLRYVFVYLLYINVKLDLDFLPDFMDDWRIAKMAILPISRKSNLIKMQCVLTKWSGREGGWQVIFKNFICWHACSVKRTILNNFMSSQKLLSNTFVSHKNSTLL